MSKVTLSTGDVITIKNGCPRRVHRKYQEMTFATNGPGQDMVIKDMNEAAEYLVTELVEETLDVDEMDARDFDKVFAACFELIKMDKDSEHEAVKKDLSRESTSS